MKTTDYVKRNVKPIQRKFKPHVLKAIEESDQILKEYADGTRKPKPFTSVHEFLQDILDEEDEDDDDV